MTDIAQEMSVGNIKGFLLQKQGHEIIELFSISEGSSVVEAALELMVAYMLDERLSHEKLKQGVEAVYDAYKSKNEKPVDEEVMKGLESLLGKAESLKKEYIEKTSYIQ